MAAHDDALEPERVEEAEDVLRVVLHRVAGVGLVALAATAQVESEDGGRPGEARRDRPSKECAFAVRPGASTRVGPGPECSR